MYTKEEEKLISNMSFRGKMGNQKIHADGGLPF
jgi:hypothetical protein